MQQCGLGSRTWLEMLLEFYANHNPGKLPSAEAILASYAGRESQLMAKLYEKYQKEPETLDATIHGVEYTLRKPHDFIALDLGNRSPTKPIQSSARRPGEQADSLEDDEASRSLSTKPPPRI